jgi:UPF0042 nucleotide-binding protein
MADKIIETSNLTVHALRKEVNRLVLSPSEGMGISITLLSFGYRYGIPFEADLVIDVRFLPNPYFVEELKNWTEKIRALFNI